MNIAGNPDTAGAAKKPAAAGSMRGARFQAVDALLHLLDGALRAVKQLPVVR